MSKADILRQLQAYKKNPDVFKEPSNAQIAELVVPILKAVEVIDQMLKDGKLHGKTPQADKDYLSEATQRQMIKEALDRFLTDTEEAIEAKTADLEKRVSERLDALADGPEIQLIAELASALVELPNFERLVSDRLTANPEAVRDSLELIVEEDEKLAQTAIQNLPEDLKQLQEQIARVNQQLQGVGTSRHVIDSVIAQRVADGTIGGGSLRFETPDGVVNSSNTSFTVDHEPLYVIIDGVQYFVGVGYSYSVGTIITDLPPSTFIRSAYSI